MNLEISPSGIKQAHKDAQKHRFIEYSDREANIHKNDGMQLSIIQDNMIDTIINGIDHRRIVLEKKAEILHDYYGDRLLAKDLFSDYLGYKKYCTATASLLSVGILGLNAYSRVMSNSVFMKKFGTISSIIALQCAGRYVSNNWLEKRIDRPWKIHTHRMSKGLGATNVPYNLHREITTTSLRFIRTQISSHDLLFAPSFKGVVPDPEFKIPLDKEHYPYAIDEEDYHKLLDRSEEKFKRLDMYESEDLGDEITLRPEQYQHLLKTGLPFPPIKDDLTAAIFRFGGKGHATIWRPEHEIKKSAFEPTSPNQVQKGTYYEPNEYDFDPLYADLEADLPPWAYYMRQSINITKERLDLLKHQWQLRLKFKEIKKQTTDEYRKTGDLEEFNRKINEFNQLFKNEQSEFLIKNTKIAAPDRQLNAFDDKKYIIFFEKDKLALEEYYNSIISTRPQMIKEKTEDTVYDYDFEVDTANYDPWAEYKMIYKDILKKGRAYYIIKSIPEWRFLQISENNSFKDETSNINNHFRYNNRDSIFNILTIDRYFHERKTKEGLYKGKSQAIRI